MFVFHQINKIFKSKSNKKSIKFIFVNDIKNIYKQAIEYLSYEHLLNHIIFNKISKNYIYVFEIIFWCKLNIISSFSKFLLLLNT